jgi:hypothetical protein
MTKAFGDWYARHHGREPSGEAVRWLAGDWVTGTLPGYENAVSPHRVRALLAYMDDDWLPEEPATVAAYKLLRNGSGGTASKPVFPNLSSSARLPSRSAANRMPATALRSASGRDQVARRSMPGLFGRTGCAGGPCYIPGVRRSSPMRPADDLLSSRHQEQYD